MTKHPDFADSALPIVFPQHEAMLRESAISPEVQRARGYRSVSIKAELQRLGFNASQSRCVPALVLPTFRPCGEPGLIQMRPDEPRHFSDGRSAKYEMPGKERMCLDVPPTVRAMIGDPSKPLFVTEGIKKGDALASVSACVVALLGVTCWRGTNEFGGKTALTDWHDVALNGRQVLIVFDSDVMRKQAVYAALRSVHEFLEGRGADVWLIYLPSGEGGAKVGVDDYLAAGNSLDELMQRATKELVAPLREEADEEASRTPYRQTKSGLVWLKSTQNGPVEVPLTNFTARIVSEVSEDDGTECKHLYRIEAGRGARHVCFDVPVSEFPSLTWATEHLGASAIVYAGFGVRDHARVAVQMLSGEPPELRVYTHTGWRQLDSGEWVYLHGNGAIGAAEPAGVSVRLHGALKHYALPEPPEGDALREAVQSVLHLFTLAPKTVTFPLISAVFRAAITGADFTLSLAGPSGAFKSELAALAQRFFGAGMDANHLPASWHSTENALEDLAHQVKDGLLVIDDFAPTGSAGDVQRLHAKADRVLRAQGNGAGRQRMRRDGSLPPARPPRGLILSTGEDVPQGKSLKARQFIIEIGPSDVDRARLTACQRDAGAGRYAECMAGFLKWLAPMYEKVSHYLPQEVVRLRERAYKEHLHRRTPEIVADLAMGLSYFAEFAESVGVLPAGTHSQWFEGCWSVLTAAAAKQAAHQQASDPPTRFIELLQAALAGGQAHVADPKGFQPDNAKAWGWRLKTVGTGEHERSEWQPQGVCIGWVDGDQLYLQKDTAYNVARQMGSDSGEGIALTPGSLYKRLNEAGLLASTDTKRETLTVRRMLQGRQQSVMHLKAAIIVWEKPDIPDIPDIGEL